MVDNKFISILAIILLLSIGCKKAVKVEDVDSTAGTNTLNDSDLGNNDIGRIVDYWYNSEEGIEARFLYHNVYITGGSNTISSPGGLNPYSDTLIFRTFPHYTVEINGVPKTISYMLSLSDSNYVSYATLYPLDETNPDTLNWCNEMLVDYENNCPENTPIEVTFDYQLMASGTGERDLDTLTNPAVFDSLTSNKEVTFESSWKNVKSIVWDHTLHRYSVVTDSLAHVMKTTFCAGICNTAATDPTNTLVYDSTYVIRNITDIFDSSIYVGIIDTNRYPITANDHMFIDRTEWERFDSTYQSTDRPYELDTTFVYYQTRIPTDSPIYWKNGDCNQNLIWNDKETYYDYGEDWCPDSLETGEGKCTVVDTDLPGEPGFGDLSDENPCNCSETLSAVFIPGFCSVSDYTDETTCEATGTCGFCSDDRYNNEITCEAVSATWILAINLTNEITCTDLTNGTCSNASMMTSSDCTVDPTQCSNGTSTNITDCCDLGFIWSSNIWTPRIFTWTSENTWTPPNDPNGDRWRDCGWDGLCPEDEGYSKADFNGTELNGIWDQYERSEGNGQYDFDINTKTGERFDDLANNTPDEPAEFCITGNDGECDADDAFEDRNCNGKWDDQELGNEGNGIWDDAEAYIDSSGNGRWETGEPLYLVSNIPETILIDYLDPENPVEVTAIDTNTSVTLYFGTQDSPLYISYNNLIENQEIHDEKRETFHDIYRKETIYTNKIMEDFVPGTVDDYYITKTKWFQDILATSYDEDELDDPQYGDNYGYDYHIFKTADNGDIIKMVHPPYFNYYGFYYTFGAYQMGTWRTELLEEEKYIISYAGEYLRSGEYIYNDTTIVTSVADYYVQYLYEVSFDSTVVIPFKKVTYSVNSLGDTLCINTSDTNFAQDPPYVDIDIEDNFIQNCPPVDTTLTNTFKITRTKTITMVGSGLELGLRNTIWLGSEGTNKPLGIVKDQLEMRWSEPYSQAYASSWIISSRIELRSLRNIESESSTLLRIFQPIKHLSLNKLVDEEIFNNEPYVVNMSYGIHRLRPTNEK